MSNKFTPGQSWEIQGQAADAMREGRFDYQAAAHALTQVYIKIPGSTIRVGEIEPGQAEGTFRFFLDLFLDDLLTPDGIQVFLTILLAGLGRPPS